MRHFIRFVFVVLLALEVQAEQTAPHLEAVPAGKLDGRKLLLDELNSSIESPATGWSWMTISSAPSQPIKVHVFACIHPEDARRFLFSVTESSAVQTEQQARSFVEGACSSTTAKPLAYALASFEKSDIPVAGKSYRFELHGKSPDGTPIVWVGYVTGSERTYSFGYTAPSEKWKDNEAEFTRFVSSFRYLREPKPTETSPSLVFAVMNLGGAAVSLLGILLLGVSLGLAGNRSTAAKNAGAGGCVLLGFAFLVPALVLPAIAPRGSDHYKMGEVLGRTTGAVLCLGIVPAAGLALCMRLVVKRRPAIPMVPPPLPGAFEPPRFPPPAPPA